MFCIHKWKNIHYEDMISHSFLNEIYLDNEFAGIKICSKCLKIKISDYGEGSSIDDLYELKHGRRMPKSLSNKELQILRKIFIMKMENIYLK